MVTSNVAFVDDCYVCDDVLRVCLYFLYLSFVTLCYTHIKFCDLGLMLFTITIRSFHFLLMRKPIPAWPLFVLEWHSRWPLCKAIQQSSRLLASPIPITSHTNLVPLSSSSSSYQCTSLCSDVEGR